MSEAKAKRLLAKAEATNLRRDQSERKAGFRAASDCSEDLIVRTAIIALYAGLSQDDWDCVAEAAAMLATLTDFHPWEQKSRKSLP